MTILYVSGGILVVLYGWGWLRYHAIIRRDQRELERKARRLAEELQREEEKPYRVLGGSRGPAENHTGKTKVGWR